MELLLIIGVLLGDVEAESSKLIEEVYFSF
jgi:hypothetical protein